jgi:hypothetical protein
MSKKEKTEDSTVEKEEVPSEPQSVISTNHVTKYNISFKGKSYQFRTPMISLLEFIDCLEFVKAAAEKTIADEKLARTDQGSPE